MLRSIGEQSGESVESVQECYSLKCSYVRKNFFRTQVLRFCVRAIHCRTQNLRTKPCVRSLVNSDQHTWCVYMQVGVHAGAWCVYMQVGVHAGAWCVYMQVGDSQTGRSSTSRSNTAAVCDSAATAGVTSCSAATTGAAAVMPPAHRRVVLVTQV